MFAVGGFTSPDIVVMLFLLGLFAGLFRWNLSLPKAAYETISLLLMLTIGLKGGMSLYGNIDSYIAAPVATSGAIKDADIGLAMLASLGLTFPFNVLVGIGLYHALIEQWI